jgi:ribonuclease HI
VAVDAFGGSYSEADGVPPPTTNNRMELTAVWKALEGLHTRVGPCEMEIVSDSKYVVLGLMYPERKRNVNHDLWDKIEDAQGLHSHVQYRHIRGHKGIKYNEAADKLAVQAKRGVKWQ